MARDVVIRRRDEKGTIERNRDPERNAGYCLIQRRIICLVAFWKKKQNTQCHNIQVKAVLGAPA